MLSHSYGTVVCSLVKSLCRILKARPVCLVISDKVLEANGIDEKGCPHGDGKGFLVLYIYTSANECRITYLSLASLSQAPRLEH